MEKSPADAGLFVGISVNRTIDYPGVAFTKVVNDWIENHLGAKGI